MQASWTPRHPRTPNISAPPTASSQQRQRRTMATLQPIKRKLDRIETERIYRVLQTVLRHIDQVKALNWLIEDDSHLFRVTNHELRQLILKHQSFARSLSSSNEDGEDNQIEIESNVQKIKDSTRLILRYCSIHGILLSSYNPTDKTTSAVDPDNLLASYFDELREMMHEKLLTEGVEEDERWRFLLQTMEKSRIARNTIQQLRKKFNVSIEQKCAIINEKEEEITFLKQKIDDIEETAEDENNTALNEAAKQIVSNRLIVENKTQKLNTDKIQYKLVMSKCVKENYIKESKLRKRKFKMAGELQNWIMKYDGDMGWRQKQVDELNELNRRDLDDLEELQQHFDKVDKEYTEIMEERRLVAEEQLRIEKEERERIEATIQIQAIWRGFYARQELENKKKGKGKKGKGKGGKSAKPKKK